MDCCKDNFENGVLDFHKSFAVFVYLDSPFTEQSVIDCFVPNIFIVCIHSLYTQSVYTVCIHSLYTQYYYKSITPPRRSQSV